MAEETPFSPFQPAAPAQNQPAATATAPASPDASKKRARKLAGRQANGAKRGRKPRAVQNAAPPQESPTAAAEAVPRTRKARKPRQAKPATVPLDLLVVASSLDEKGAQILAGVVQALSTLRKPARRKLVEALQRLT